MTINDASCLAVNLKKNSDAKMHEIIIVRGNAKYQTNDGSIFLSFRSNIN